MLQPLDVLTELYSYYKPEDIVILSLTLLTTFNAGSVISTQQGKEITGHACILALARKTCCYSHLVNNHMIDMHGGLSYLFRK